MNAAQHRKIVAASQPNAPLAPDGPVVEQFAPQSLAQALEEEITRTRQVFAGCAWQTITLHMDIPDARQFVKTLSQSENKLALRFAQELLTKLLEPSPLPKLSVTMNIDTAVTLAQALRQLWVVA